MWAWCSRPAFPVFTIGAGLGFIALGVAMRYVETPLRLYREDPDLRLHFAVAPVPGGAGLGVSGTF